jgi:hypothetical protein
MGTMSRLTPVWLATLAGGAATAARGALDPSFLLMATGKDLAGNYPTYLANGYVSTLSTSRGTEATLAYMVGFMDYAADDESRPAAIPGWTEIDYSTDPSPSGQAWLNKAQLTPSFEILRVTSVN